MKPAGKKRAILCGLCAVLLIIGVLQFDSVQIRLLSLGLHSSSRVTKEMVLLRLRPYGERAVPFIAAELQNEDVNARAHAAAMLGEMGFASAVKPLTETLQDLFVLPRSTAAMALGEIGDRSAIPALKNALQHESQSARLVASIALADLGDDSGTVYLVRGLGIYNQWIRNKCAAALRKLTGETFGYDPHMLPSHQEDQIALWQEWLIDWRLRQSALARTEIE